MPRLNHVILLSAACAAATFVAGCSKPAAPPHKMSQTEQTSTEQAMSAEDAEAASIAKAIAELPEAERAVALAQKTCPVGDSPLGSMGMPFKVTVKGRDVYLCCAGCKDSIEKDPEKYLAKIDQQTK